MFRDQLPNTSASRPASPGVGARCERSCCRCCFSCCSSASNTLRLWLGAEPRYSPAFHDNRPDSSSLSSSHYQAPSPPSRDLSATGQAANTSDPEGSALLGKVQNSSTELQDTGSATRSPIIEATKHRSPATWKRANGDYAGHNDSRLHRRIQSVEHIAKLAEAKTAEGSPRVPKLGSGLSLAPDDEDACPTCLEPYSEENPKILTQCQHHFHLACIYEWLERSQTCPICSRQMSFDEFL